MRQIPSSWALLVVAGALFTMAGSAMTSTDIGDEVAWVFLGVALTLVGQWSALEVHRVMQRRNSRKDEVLD